jgi:hypothetical protein
MKQFSGKVILYETVKNWTSDNQLCKMWFWIKIIETEVLFLDVKCLVTNDYKVL